MTKPLLEQNNCHVRSRPKIDQDLSATKTDRMKEVITSDQEWEKNPFYGFRGDCSRKGLNTTVFGYTVGGVRMIARPVDCVVVVVETLPLGTRGQSINGRTVGGGGQCFNQAVLINRCC